MAPTTPELPPRAADPDAAGERPDEGHAPADRPVAARRVRASPAAAEGAHAPARDTGHAGQVPPRVPAQRRGGSGRAPLPVAAGVAACWAAIASYVPVALVLWLAEMGDVGTLAGAARVGLAGWLLGHGVPLGTSAGPLGLPPLALGALAAWRAVRAGVHVTRAIGARESGSPRRALTVSGAVGVAYGLVGALAALLAGTATTTVAPLRAGLTLAVFGAVAALVGALRTTGALWVLARRTPPPLRHGLRTGLVAAVLVLGAGAGAAGLAVAMGGGDASDMIGAYRTGVAGQAGITLISIAYAPNAAVWAASYLLGPGFAVGTGTTVSTTDVTLGALPAVPVLAGLPHGPVGGFGAVLLAVPVLAGMTAGWLLGRRRLRGAQRGGAPVEWGGLLSAAAIAGPVSGVMLGLAAIVSSGPLGGGRLAEIGPVPWQVAAAASLLVTLGAGIGAAGTRAFAGP